MRRLFCPSRGRRLAMVGLLLAGGATTVRAQSDQAIYVDSLQTPWQDWSWGCNRSFNSTAVVHGGTAAVSVTLTQSWGAISFYHGNFDSSPYTNLTFWIHGGPTGGQQLKIYAETNGAGAPSIDLPTLPANTWTQLNFSLQALGVANRPDFSRFNIQDRSGSTKPVFYLDDIRLQASGVTLPAVTLTAPADGAIYSLPTTVPLAATVTTNGHTINKVQFYAGGTLAGEDATPPYTNSWVNPAAGTYAVFARLVYDGSVTRDSTPATIVVASNTPVTIVVNTLVNRHPISPLIYGTCFATATQLADLNCPIHRSGGNSETRYNWQLNAHNRAADWYFESLADSSSTPAASSDDFVSTSRTAGAEPMLTIPMIGWMPKVGPSRGKLASYSTNKYGPQTDTDWQWMPTAGNGVGTNSTNHTSWLITTNDPTDANFLTNSSFQQAFVQHLTNRWGLSTNGGVKFYLMDNEHSIWHSTHRDVHPNGASRKEIRDKFFEYAAMVKALDPNALIGGPEEFGWSGYLNSGADLQYGSTYGWGYLPDRSTNGGLDYVAWFLDQCRQRDTNANQRLLDYFTLHRYTEDNGVGGNDVSTTTQLKRNRATRSFWDPSYVDETWINQPVKLIPRMKDWVNTYYPGTMLGITEYNWGAESHINGATTQGDILGIFGREGLDLATRWTTPDASTPTYKAMKLYRNYDGKKSTFGDISVLASGANPDNVSVYAAQRSSDNALTVMVINKQLGATALPSINVVNFVPAGTAQAYQLTAANTITRLADLAISGASLTSSVPPQSLTLFVIPAAPVPGVAQAPSPTSGALNVSTNTFLGWVAGANASGHQIYFGYSSNAVFNATTNSAEFKGRLSNPVWTPGPLAAAGRFYWRVDEVNDFFVTAGPVWTFATAVASAGVSVRASSSYGTNCLVSFPSLPGQVYRVERSGTLVPTAWVTVGDLLTGTGGRLEVADALVPGEQQQYYRVVLLAP